MLSDRDWTELQQLLDALPAPCEPLDVVMLDGYLCALLLQPRPVDPARWWPPLLGVQAKRMPALPEALRGLVQRRHAQLEAAISQRQWFDPCVFELADAQSASEPVMPWVAGFDLALQHFALPVDDAQVLEPLALLYRHLGGEALEEGQDALIEQIELLEPPVALADAVEELVRSVLLMADITRPQPSRSARPTSGARPAPRRPRRPA